MGDVAGVAQEVTMGRTEAVPEIAVRDSMCRIRGKEVNKK